MLQDLLDIRVCETLVWLWIPEFISIAGSGSFDFNISLSSSPLQPLELDWRLRGLNGGYSKHIAGNSIMKAPYRKQTSTKIFNKINYSTWAIKSFVFSVWMPLCVLSCPWMCNLNWCRGRVWVKVQITAGLAPLKQTGISFSWESSLFIRYKQTNTGRTGSLKSSSGGIFTPYPAPSHPKGQMLLYTERSGAVKKTKLTIQ